MIDHFISSWHAKFDNSKYPIDFYLSCIESLKDVQSPAELGELIIALLYWKDGKVKHSGNGNFTVGGQVYDFGEIKPNTYNASKHEMILKSSDFFEWARLVRDFEEFDPMIVDDLRGEKFELWSKNSLVIPAFVLHILAPNVYPLYDQHVERAKRYLEANTKDIYLDKKPDLKSYVSYQAYFFKTLFSYLNGSNSFDLKDVKLVDGALWSYGKFLKRASSKPNQKNAIEAVTIETLGNDAAQNPIGYFVPDDDFKRLVISYLTTSNCTNREAIKSAAEERKVLLSPSYYAYPASHIHRWRQQGF